MKRYPHPLVLTQREHEQPVIGFSIRGMAIYDPTLSECARFKVSPAYYGLTDSDVQELAALNKAIDTATENATNAGGLAIQQFLRIATGDEAGVFFSGNTALWCVFAEYAIRETRLAHEESEQGEASTATPAGASADRLEKGAR
jgi:hypothetical protein